jgi:hypothetical protein
VTVTGSVFPVYTPGTFDALSPGEYALQYDTVNGDILLQYMIPEPSAAILLVFGALVLSRGRRRMQA